MMLMTGVRLYGSELKMPAIFADGMVLQRDKPVSVWGWADAGTEVTVEFAGQKKTATVTSTNREWRVTLDPMKANAAPQTMSVRGRLLNSDSGLLSSSFTNVLVGDVWLCSGQSNMEMPVGYISWTGGALNYEAEIKSSANPLIRQFRVEWDRKGYSPKYGDGTWLTAGPETTERFSATGYFFAREVQKQQKIPIAIINASQGATAIEWWISREEMMADPECRKQVEEQTEDFKVGQFRRLNQWAADHTVWQEKYGRKDSGVTGGVAVWAGPSVDMTDWKKVQIPGSYSKAGCLNGGIMWLRREIDVPALYTNRTMIQFSCMSDVFSVYINGKECGANGLTNGYGRPGYAFSVPKGVILPGKNVIAIRMHTSRNAGSVSGNAEQLRLAGSMSDKEGVSLAGEWLCKAEIEYPALPKGADAMPKMAAGPGIHYYYTALKFDSIIKPVIPYTISGVVWYQGEHNTGRTHEYRKLIKMFIHDWRSQWGAASLPFYICQLPNNGLRLDNPGDSKWAELREAQTTALELPGTYLANLIDNAEDGDLHPRNKQEVGHRLALLALANSYGDRSVACYGPMYDTMTIKDGKVVVKFKHAEGGLVAKPLPANYRMDLKKPDSEVKPLVLPSPGSEVQGFAVYGTVAQTGGGTSNQWVWADAKIDGSEVVVRSDKVAKPEAIRYAWADHPVCNLYNKAGLPVYQFRTDKAGE